MTDDTPHARATTIIRASPDTVLSAFIEPARLTRFWLASSSGPLAVGVTVQWQFMVPGAATTATATRLGNDGIGWNWADGSTVDVDVEKVDGGTAVTVVNAGFGSDRDAAVARALDGTEGFAFVLAALKMLLETGDAGGIVRDKARLIALRR